MGICIIKHKVGPVVLKLLQCQKPNRMNIVCLEFNHFYFANSWRDIYRIGCYSYITLNIVRVFIMMIFDGNFEKHEIVFESFYIFSCFHTRFFVKINVVLSIPFFVETCPVIDFCHVHGLFVLHVCIVIALVVNFYGTTFR